MAAGKLHSEEVCRLVRGKDGKDGIDRVLLKETPIVHNNKKTMQRERRSETIRGKGREMKMKRKAEK